ncbi:flagellar hook-associated protein FlgL [Campylobacter sp. faydin G-140]|uniref:flagellar hook-associated protein FlgL n=1 Tax=Campylobacter anatolicus TaxID=2829105 RepID=UPI001B9001B9|nr:flagellar hook-associated protein FlgL [Campylobacter anatolicus]MBR8462925.1 flagellar hook-associated protein FlgL [Campylobacter anatolicus]MBR8465810.1 flagellar hook-associated protein FlgL [Campylobacter anatolicus]
MRITNQWRYSQTLYDYQRSMAEVNKNYQQISSGLKINQSYEGAATYNDAMRLDYEVATIDQVIEATSKSVNFAKNTDKSISEFVKQLEKFKVKVVQAASDINSTTSLEAIANDLQGIKNHLVNIANTSINGQFLFSGSAVDTKPIDGSGNYQGNKEYMKTHSGAQVEIAHNIPGYDMFLGKDSDYRKIITTNVIQVDRTRADTTENPKILNGESKIKNMIGLNYVKQPNTINKDYDFVDKDVKFPDTYFYMQGKKPDGTSFTSKFKMTADTTIDSLMEKIGYEFGNTATTKVVDVSINADGQFNIKDLTKGNQVIDFHMVAATTQVNTKDDLATANAAIASTDTLANLETLANNGSIYITEFTKSNFKDNNGVATNSFDYTKVRFAKKDNTVTSNVSQIVRATGEFATDSTRLSQVAGTKTLYPNSNDRYNIDNKNINMKIVSKSGATYNIKVKLGTQDPSVPVTFDISGTAADGTQLFNGATRILPVYNSDEFGTYRTQTNDFTYRQLMDIVGMVASDNIPPQSSLTTEGATITQAQREANSKAMQNEIIKSRGSVSVELDHSGKVVLKDLQNAVTPIELAMYDEDNTDKFYGDSTGTTTADSQGGGAAFNFSANNAITIDEPSVNLFKELDDMIFAVRNGYYRADSEAGDPRNTGMQGAIERLDHFMDHVNKQVTKIGSQTKLLTSTQERAEIMKVNVSSVKSEVIDADYAKAYLSFTQKSMAYQAMLQATSKINQLSLLNYM